VNDPKANSKVPAFDKERQRAVVSWGHVGPQPKVQARHATYHFPQGLTGVKQMTSGDVGHLFVKDDGTLVCWDISLGLGGRTLWHKHLEEIKDVEKAVASRISPGTLTRQVNMGGVFLWENDGTCTFHYKHYDSYSDYLSWGKDKTPFENRFKKKSLGTDVSSIVLANSNTLFDIAIRLDGTLIPVNNSTGRGKETDALAALVQEINASGETRLLNCIKAFSKTDRNWKDGGMEYTASLVWLNRDGEVWRISTGEKKPNNISKGLKLPAIQDIERPALGSEGDPDLFLVLIDGILQVLNLTENIFTSLPKQASYEGVQERISALFFCGDSFSLALTETGRCLFVTAEDLTRFKPNYRRLFTKRWVSPEGMRFSQITASVNLNAITDEVTFLGIADACFPAHNQQPPVTPSPNTKAQLLVWGKDSQKETPIAVHKIASNIGPVQDATVFKLFYIGLVAVLSDGSLVVMNPVQMDRGDFLDSIPPWFPADFHRVDAETGSGLIARRNTGEILKWGPSEIQEGIFLSLEKVDPKLLSKIPGDFKKARKLVGAGGSSCFNPPYHYLAPDVLVAVL